MNAPDPFEGLSPALRSAFERRGFDQLTPVQRAVVDADLAQHDLRISSQTGSGKTVALGLALAANLTEEPEPGPRALVLAPTRELASQVARELRELFAEMPWRVDVVTGGTDPVAEKKALKRSPDILVATPGRLLDHARSRAVDLSRVRDAVLDEADQMLDMGFRDELEQILAQVNEERRMHMVSATFAKDVLRFADRYQRDVLHLAGTRLGDANTDIEHVAHLVLPAERRAALVNLLLADHATGPSAWLVFVKRRTDAAELAELLVEDGFSAMAFSGELSQTQRERALSAFKRGLVKVLVATDVAARGIDVSEVSVVHFELPSDVESFVHRSGRTGRAGQKGRSVALVVPSAERRARELFKRARVEVSWSPVPDAKKIEKAAVKKSRRAVRNRLAAEVDISTARLEYAQSLLEGQDPARVVAVLLDMVTQELPREPESVRPLEPRGSAPRSRNAGPHRARPRKPPFKKATGPRSRRP